ncbi:MAG: nitroreductase/quinone reductase family protein [Myxococcota bacterium]|jgi:hypothetical protein|nr:nitroreductase/quinone reductase family protein [Myxococcota bacterium]
MSSKTPTRLIVVLGALTVACSGPFVLFPGGALEGRIATAPTDWGFTADTDTIQLETNPGDPYSVNIWAIGLGNVLYVHAGASHATWIENMEADPRVRVRIGETVYELNAARVEDQAEFDRFSAVYEEKYGNPPRNPSVEEAYLFRLRPRQG